MARRSRKRSSDKPTIRIGNSYTYLENLPDKVMDKIQAQLSYHNETAEMEKVSIMKLLRHVKFGVQRGKVKYWLEKKMEKEGFYEIEEYQSHLRKELARAKAEENVCLLRSNNSFPTGLAVKVLGKLPKSLLEGDLAIDDQRVVPEPKVRYKWKSEPDGARPYQNEMMEESRENERGVFEACVASGKTWVMGNIIYEKRLVTLVVLPSSDLLKQTKNTLSKWFGKTKVQHVTSADVKRGGKLKPIRVVTIQTLASMLEQNIFKKLVKDVDMIMMDEFHHAGSKSYTDLMDQLEHVYYRYGFTGTFLRNDSKEMNMHGILSTVLYQYPLKRGIAEGYITPTQIYIHALPGKEAYKYHTEYTKNYCGSKVLLNEIGRIIKNIKNNEQTLILVKQKEKAGDIIHKYLKSLGIENTYISGDTKDNDKAIQAFNEKKINILIGTKVIGEGIDVHSTQHLILATGGKSEIELIQAIGRCVRLHPGKDLSYVYDFRFTGTKYMDKHTDQRILIYREQFGEDAIKQAA